MTVEVRIPTVFRKFTGGESTVKGSPGTLADLISELDQKYPGLRSQLMADESQLHRFVNVYVNDEDVRFTGGLETSVSDGDQVVVLPAVAGG